ncbi:hypothetical protein BV22DRAFT_1041645 [Leucogyrophana mollusca]|uniref:Uncharacterized protein n=1 Tax=Leucogyrophana mollusca TaxID=85980 RepID=A0ACB8B0G0_9AGAM|nr:hypothetical protein BV22DRAFT_1041645 [Leucogyrophana mollusca]
MGRRIEPCKRGVDQEIVGDSSIFGRVPGDYRIPWCRQGARKYIICDVACVTSQTYHYIELQFKRCRAEPIWNIQPIEEKLRDLQYVPCCMEDEQSFNRLHELGSEQRSTGRLIRFANLLKSGAGTARKGIC